MIQIPERSQVSGTCILSLLPLVGTNKTSLFIRVPDETTCSKVVNTKYYLYDGSMKTKYTSTKGLEYVIEMLLDEKRKVSKIFIDGEDLTKSLTWPGTPYSIEEAVDSVKEEIESRKN